LLEILPQEAIFRAIEGIAAWLDSWRKYIVNLRQFRSVWFGVWPVAVEATNAQQSRDEPFDLNVVARESDDSDPMDLDTLNTPAGKLVGVFLQACPTVQSGDRPFKEDDDLWQMRDSVVSAAGRSGLIARHRLIESVQWFQAADPAWTRDYLLAPLR